MGMVDLLEYIDFLIDEEINIRNLQSEDYNPETLENLWELRKIVSDKISNLN